MRTFLGVLFLALFALSSRTPAGTNDPEAAPQGVENMSDHGATNSNSPATGDQLQGQERAEERHDMKSDRGATTSAPTRSKKKSKEGEY